MGPVWQVDPMHGRAHGGTPQASTDSSRDSCVAHDPTRRDSIQHPAHADPLAGLNYRSAQDQLSILLLCISQKPSVSASR